MFESHVVTSVDRTSFDFRFEDFLSNPCYWPTIHNSIWKICPKFQAISSHFFGVDELLDEYWAKIVQSENISTPIYAECDKMYQLKVCFQEFWYIVAGLDIQPEQSENNSPASKKAAAGFETLQLIYHFFLQIDTNPWLSG